MFNATPRLRDLLDVRTIVLVAVIALGAFGLQLLFLARTVASPLGGAIADFDRVPQVESAPPQAIARAGGDAAPVRDAAVRVRPAWEPPVLVGMPSRPLPAECLVQR
jgi:hypothetical protein